MKFVNEAKPVVKREEWENRPGSYKFDRAPKYLFVWSRLFQFVISQATTYLLTGKFHTQQCSIYKTEGGCAVPGVGDLVLSNSSCYFDHWIRDDKNRKADDERIAKVAWLISYVVLNWDPNDPIDSMLKAAASQIKVDADVLKKAIETSKNSLAFGGNALADFFDWNPFSEAPIDRKYERYCLVKFSGMTDAEVDQKYADLDLGKKLLEKINVKIKSCSKNNGWTMAMCCSPRRFEADKSLHFWINTGRSTVIDGWHTQESIQKFLDSDGALNDTAKY